ncbi:MAG: tetratricopeptide repeat protein, partial [Verrucomicrobiota bacterium]
EMSEIAMHTNKLVRAQEHLQYLERRWRSNPRYPEIIWNLMLVEMKENRKYLACKWARKLFAKYPGHALVKDWGIELPNNLVDGEKVGCAASDKDVQQRMRDLQLAGADQKARQEIDFLRAHARPNEKTHTDTMLANYYEMQGYPDEALQILIQHYDELKNNFNYQSMLGKVATQAGEFQAAIGAYYNSYRLSPRSKGGRGALFSSGFLSYQIQDYDGAYRRFTDLIKKNGSSGLARDARWHLAWIQYLKGDFAGAESEFRKLYKEKIYVSRRRRRTTPQPFHNERTEYWLAMTLVRQKKYDEARELLRELSSSKGRSFYAIVAEARLSQLPETPAPAAPPAPVQAAAPASAPSVAPSPAVATAPADKTVATSTGGEREEAGAVGDVGPLQVRGGHRRHRRVQRVDVGGHFKGLLVGQPGRLALGLNGGHVGGRHAAGGDPEIDGGRTHALEIRADGRLTGRGDAVGVRTVAARAGLVEQQLAGGGVGGRRVGVGDGVIPIPDQHTVEADQLGAVERIA